MRASADGDSIVAREDEGGRSPPHERQAHSIVADEEIRNATFDPHRLLRFTFCGMSVLRCYLKTRGLVRQRA